MQNKGKMLPLYNASRATSLSKPQIKGQIKFDIKFSRITVALLDCY